MWRLPLVPRLPLVLACGVESISCESAPAPALSALAPSPAAISGSMSLLTVPLGQPTATTCDTRCPACASGETLICRHVRIDVPTAGTLAIRIDAETTHPLALSMSPGPGAAGSATGASGPPPLITTQPVSRGSVMFGLGVVDANGEQVPMSITATLEY